MNNTSTETPTPTESVTIKLSDGKERALRYTLGSVKRLGKRFGGSLLSANSPLASMDEEKVSAMLIEGLRGGGEIAMTEDVLDELVEIRDIAMITQKIIEAWTNSLGQPKNG